MNPTAHDLRIELGRLLAERMEAVASGLDGDAEYLRQLDEAVEECREAYVGLAVTEIATLRAELSGPLQG